MRVGSSFLEEEPLALNDVWCINDPTCPTTVAVLRSIKGRSRRGLCMIADKLSYNQYYLAGGMGKTGDVVTGLV